MGGHHWARIELEALRKYPVISKQEMLSCLPGRNWKSIKQKAYKLSLYKLECPWKVDDV